MVTKRSVRSNDVIQIVRDSHVKWKRPNTIHAHKYSEQNDWNDEKKETIAQMRKNGKMRMTSRKKSHIMKT